MKFRQHREESLDNEIRDYIEHETQDNIAAGMSLEDARHAAMRKFGRPVLNIKEETRAVWGWRPASLRIALLAWIFARSSRYLPRRINVTMSAATSK